MYLMVEEAESILSNPRNLDEFGKLLHEAWVEKRSLSSRVSNHVIDDLYETARSAGAIGGKIAGAGGGGMLLLFVPLDKQMEVRNKLHNMVHIPFRFEPKASEIIFVDKRLGYEEKEESRNRLAQTQFVELRDI
jgi:D-glycero-alpha-D-manno-heptose-7-phosphate kinase